MRLKKFRRMSLIITVVLVFSCLTGITVYAGNAGQGCGYRYENQYQYCTNCGAYGICDPDCDGIPDRDRLRDRDRSTLGYSRDSDCDGTQKKDRDRIHWTLPV